MAKMHSSSHIMVTPPPPHTQAYAHSLTLTRHSFTVDPHTGKANLTEAEKAMAEAREQKKQPRGQRASRRAVQGGQSQRLLKDAAKPRTMVKRSDVT